MNAELLVEELKNCLGGNLKAAYLYGSSVLKEGIPGASDENILLVVDDVSLRLLKTMAPVVKTWMKRGNPVPMIFSLSMMERATDVFPIEFLDIRARHRLLWGDDILKKLDIRLNHFRHQLEFELRGKFLLLTRSYIELEGQEKKVVQLIGRSLSSVSTLFRGVLRLLNRDVPGSQEFLWQTVGQHCGFDGKIFLALRHAKEHRKASPSLPVDDLFAGYLKAIGAVTEFVDSNQNFQNIDGGSL